MARPVDSSICQQHQLHCITATSEVRQQTSSHAELAAYNSLRLYKLTAAPILRQFKLQAKTHFFNR